MWGRMASGEATGVAVDAGMAIQGRVVRRVVLLVSQGEVRVRTAGSQARSAGVLQAQGAEVWRR